MQIEPIYPVPLPKNLHLVIIAHSYCQFHRIFLSCKVLLKGAKRLSAFEVTLEVRKTSSKGAKDCEQQQEVNAKKRRYGECQELVATSHRNFQEQKSASELGYPHEQ